MKKALVIKRTADARPKNPQKLHSRSKEKSENISILNFQEKIHTQKKRIVESPLERAIKKFLKQAQYQNPICFGWLFVFPDGDCICERCSKNKPLNIKEIEKIASFLKEQKIEIGNLAPQEMIELIYSCRARSDRRLADFENKIRETETDIRKRFQDDNEEILETRVKKTLEPLFMEFEREKEKIVKKRKEGIKNLMKGG